MNSSHKLAIVIPAYKIAFFKESIESIANQTCKDFTLYIGDDASPFDFNEIINFYKDKINIIYQRFEKNLGGKDLVAHWNRCIDMIQNEEWIWLFSDDDLMEHNCVELFYKHIEKHKEDSLLHFNLQIINEKGINIFKVKKFESHYSTSEYFAKVINHKVYSCAVEYIFKKKNFEEAKRFEPFDLAWSSDTATWMKLSLYGGIKTIEGAVVKWRLSNLNISSMSDDKSIVLRKAEASVKYIKWAILFFKQNNIFDITSGTEKMRWLLMGIVYTKTLSFNEKYNMILRSLNRLNLDNLKYKLILVWLFEELKRNIKSTIFYKR